MRILVTGSRNWTGRITIEMALYEAWRTLGFPQSVTLVHGACPTGADAVADEAGRRNGWEMERHRADWDKYGKAAGPIRNQEMVDAGADICVAFLLPESRGTRDCIRRAKAAGIEVREYTL